LAELRETGHLHKTVKAEIRDNLLARLAAGEPTFPGILGYDETVIPESSGPCSPATTWCCWASAGRARPG